MARNYFKDLIVNDKVNAHFVAMFLNEDAFSVKSEKVLAGNEFIKNGDSPTGLRDITFSFSIVVTKGSERVRFHRENPEDLFSVKFLE